MLKDMIRKQPAVGTLLKVSRHPSIIKQIKDTGFDTVIIDMEHSDYTLDCAADLILYGNALHLESIVRVSECTKQEVSKVLDTGASGVIVPMVNSRTEAEKLVGWAKYPPVGIRGYAGGANTGYGPSGNHRLHLEAANQTIMAIAQIETREAINNIDEIAAVDGLDMLMIGPVDLSINLGLADDSENAIELALIKTVADACRRHNKLFSIIGSLSMLSYFQNDLDLFVSGSDSSLMRQALLEQQRKIKTCLPR